MLKGWGIRADTGGMEPITKNMSAEHHLWWWHITHYGEGVNMPATYRKLVEEVGELGEAMMAGTKDEAAIELGDAATLLIVLARGMGYSLERVLQAVICKLRSRDAGLSKLTETEGVLAEWLKNGTTNDNG